jgi:hypothetical protein
MRRRLGLMLLCAVVGCLAHAGDISACAIDQRPSLSVDGRLARINTLTPSGSQALATWSFFVLPGTLPAGRQLAMAEDRREVARTLTAEAMRQPCAWTFGDGRVGYGWRTRHAYAHAGVWRIGVYVWDPAGGRWDLIDQATITTR